MEQTTPTTFSDLPAELRLQIWRCTFPGPQIVKVFYDQFEGCISPTSPPIILAVCHQSRREALRSYTLLNGPHSSQRIFIRLNFDTLYFSLEDEANTVPGDIYLSTCLRNLRKEATLSLTHVAVDFDAYAESQEQDPVTRRWTVGCLLILRNLEKLSIVAGTMDGNKEMRDALDFVELEKPKDNDISNQTVKDSYQCGCCKGTHALDFFYTHTQGRIQYQIEQLQDIDKNWKCPDVDGVAVWR